MSKELRDLDLEAEVRFRNFNWGKAKTFYIIAKLGSYSAASTSLRISQSALSRQILELEETLGSRLFIRESRGVKLTRKGEELYSIVETTFLNIKGFTRNTHAELNNTGKRKIRISTTHAIVAYVLDTHILAYNRENPHLTFELISDDQMIDIIVNDVDIAIRPFDSSAHGVCQEPLFTLEKKLFASESYISKYGEPQTIEDLSNHHLLSFARPEELPYADVNWILKIGMPEGKLRKPIYTSNSIESVVKAAKQGIGIIANYDEMEIIRDSGLKNILPKVKDKKIKEYFIYPDYLQNDEEILKLKKYLQNKYFEK